jgi:hypothetical protein
VIKTTYYEDKLHLPRQVKEKLGLVDGDVLRIEVVDKDTARLSLAHRCRASKRILEKR